MIRLALCLVAMVGVALGQTSNPAGGSGGGGLTAPVALATQSDNNAGSMTNANAATLFSPSSGQLPTNLLANSWSYLGSSTCSQTGASWTVNVPTSRILRVTGTIGYDVLGGSSTGNGYYGIQFNGDSANNYTVTQVENWASSTATKSSVTNYFIPGEWQGENIKTGVVHYVLDVWPGSGTLTNATSIYYRYETWCDGAQGAGTDSIFTSVARGRYFGGSVLTNISFMNTPTINPKVITSTGTTRADFYGVR